FQPDFRQRRTLVRRQRFLAHQRDAGFPAQLTEHGGGGATGVTGTGDDDAIGRHAQRRLGEAATASGEVMSAKLTDIEVRTSITVGTRAAIARFSAGASCAGSVTRSPSQPIARAMAERSKSLNSAANDPEP